MMLISRRFKLTGAIAATLSLTCATLAAAQTRKVAPAGPAKAIELKAPLPDLKINLTAAGSLCTPQGKVNVEVIVRVINEGKGVADFSKVPFQTVIAVKSWSAVDPDGTVTPAFGNVDPPKSRRHDRAWARSGMDQDARGPRFTQAQERTQGTRQILLRDQCRSRGRHRGVQGRQQQRRRQRTRSVLQEMIEIGVQAALTGLSEGQ